MNLRCDDVLRGLCAEGAAAVISALSWWSLARCALLFSVLFLQSCAKQADKSETSPSAAEQLSQPGQQASWLRELRRAHQVADQAQSPLQRQQALSGLRRILQELPDSRAADVVWIRQDAQFRIAQLELLEGRAQRAVAASEQGLALSKEPSVAVSNLHLIHGQALEQLQHKDEAIEAYHQALLVNEVLMKRSLGDDD